MVLHAIKFVRPHRFAALGLGLSLAGCMAPEAALQRGIAVPAHYDASTSEKAALSQHWPKLFGSSELEKLTSQAVAGNFDIAIASAKIQQARAQVQVNGAALAPNLSGYGDASRAMSPGTAHAKNPPFNSSVGNSFDLGLTASYMLDFWGKNAAGVESAQDSLIADTFNRDVVQLSTLTAVTNAYLQSLAAQDRLRIARENVKITEEVLDAIRGRLKVGTSTALDEVSQQVLNSNAKASIPALELVVQQSRNTLAVLLGQTPESLKLSGGSLANLRVPRISAGLPSQLLTRRPDLAQAEAQLAAQKANVIVARAAMLPNVQLAGKLGLQSLTLQNLLRPEAALASLASSITQPIFDGGNLQGQLDSNRAVQEQLLLAYRKSIISAFADVENALAAVRLQSQHEQLQSEAVKSSRRAYDINTKILKEGTIDLVNLLNSEQSLFNAQDALVQIRLAKFQAYVSLTQALGGGWQMPVNIKETTKP